MTWWRRDPDLGRDRETKALGRRDWNWFSPYADTTGAGATPADTEPAQAPWAGNRITGHDRHDRTLGIPPRHISMWPNPPSTLDIHGTWSPDRSADAIADDLRWLHQPPPPPDIPTGRLTAALTDIATHAYARPPHVQQLILVRTAIDHGLDLTDLTQLARGIGEMTAKTTHRSTRDQPGEPALNALTGANLPLAAELYLARAHITRATTCSDPDLPRLWILANALTHRVPAHVILTVPARSHGPIARLHPTHHDLVGWRGVSAAVEHLHATVDAVRRGHHWLTTASDNPTNRLLALGILDLTHPTQAARLTTRKPEAASIDHIRATLARHPAPTAIADLTDPALKAVCDRNGWLHGTPDERTHRELIERQLGTLDPAFRARLARGDLDILTDPSWDDPPTDPDADRTTRRDQPPASDAVHSWQLLNAASREALHRFADLDITPHSTGAAALAARYPDRIGQRVLRIAPADLTLHIGQLPESPAPPAQTELDFGGL